MKAPRITIGVALALTMTACAPDDEPPPLTMSEMCEQAYVPISQIPSPPTEGTTLTASRSLDELRPLSDEAASAAVSTLATSLHVAANSPGDLSKGGPALQVMMESLGRFDDECRAAGVTPAPRSTRTP